MRDSHLLADIFCFEMDGGGHQVSSSVCPFFPLASSLTSFPLLLQLPSSSPSHAPLLSLLPRIPRRHPFRPLPSERLDSSPHRSEGTRDDET